MNLRPLSFTALSAAALLSGCAFHNSYLVGDRYFRANIDTQPLIILGVDNWDSTESPVQVEPGERLVRVQALPVPGAPQQTATLKLDVQPCFTYFIVADRPNPIGASFTPRVDYAQPLAGCTPKPKAS